VKLVLFVVSLLLCALAGAQDYSVTVSVKNDKGLAVQGAQVSAQMAYSSYLSTTNGGGTVTFYFSKPGKVTLVATDEAAGTGTATAEVSDDHPKTSVVIFLKQGPAATYTLTVNVISEMGDNSKPVQGATVSVSGSDSATQTTGADGSTTFKLAHRGAYKITVSHPNFPSVSRATFLASPDKPVEENFALKAEQSTMTIAVRVTNEKGDPVEGASAFIEGPDSKTVLQTDPNGVATFRIANNERRNSESKAFIVKVSKSGYESGSGSVVPQPGGQDQAYSVAVVLKRKIGTYQVSVEVYEKGTRAPVMDAQVSIRSRDLGVENASGSTNGAGKVVLAPGYGANGTYTVTVTRKGYKSIQDSLPVNKNQRAYHLSYELAPDQHAKLYMRLFAVQVLGRTPKGNTVPVKNAVVTTSFGASGATDVNGRFAVLHAIPSGESINVTVVPPEHKYKKGSGSTIVGTRGVPLDADAFQSAQFKAWEKQERARLMKESPGEVDVFERVSDALGRSASYPVTQLFMKAWNDTWGTRQAVDNVTVTCEPGSDAARIDGNMVPDKGRVGYDELVNVALPLTYTGGNSPTVTASETIQVIKPDGTVFKTYPKQRTLKLDVPDRPTMDFSFKSAGTWTIRQTVHAQGLPERRDEIKIGVSPATAGWVLVQKRIRKPGGGEEVSTSETSYVTTRYKITYSDPPPVMEVGKTYVFTATSTHPEIANGRWTCPIAEDNPGIHAHYSADSSGRCTVKIEAPPRKDPTPTGRTLLTMFTIGRGQPIGEFLYEWRSK
jgi:hypothetical protein